MAGNGRKRQTEDTFLDDVRDRQRNTVWPDTLRSEFSVNALLWKGSRNAPIVQRVGIAVIGFAFLFSGVGFGYMAYTGREAILAVFAALPTLIGIRVFWNAFRH